jgi:MoaA/NifB/PqqE/SkfB family radical SAM enzyme
VRLEAAGSRLKVDLGLDSDPILAAEIGLSSAHQQCICGIHSVTIKPNGDVVPCSFAPEIIGNVLQQSTLLQIWRESPALKRLREGSSSPCGE